MAEERINCRYVDQRLYSAIGRVREQPPSREIMTHLIPNMRRRRIKVNEVESASEKTAMIFCSLINRRSRILFSSFLRMSISSSISLILTNERRRVFVDQNQERDEEESRRETKRRNSVKQATFHNKVVSSVFHSLDRRTRNGREDCLLFLFGYIIHDNTQSRTSTNTVERDGHVFKNEVKNSFKM
jgi:hypothetical protein